jgi:hypothetical protein
MKVTFSFQNGPDIKMVSNLSEFFRYASDTGMTTMPKGAISEDGQSFFTDLSMTESIKQ